MFIGRLSYYHGNQDIFLIDADTEEEAREIIKEEYKLTVWEAKYKVSIQPIVWNDSEYDSDKIAHVFSIDWL